MTDLAKRLKYFCDRCSFGLGQSDNPGTALQPCPFTEELYGERDLCNCCENCRNSCAEDV